MSSAKNCEPTEISECAEKMSDKLRRRPRGRPRKAEQAFAGVPLFDAISVPESLATDDAPILAFVPPRFYRRGVPERTDLEERFAQAEADTHLWECSFFSLLHAAFRSCESTAAAVRKAYKPYADACADLDAMYLPQIAAVGGPLPLEWLRRCLEAKLNNAKYAHPTRSNLYAALYAWAEVCTWAEIRTLPSPLPARPVAAYTKIARPRRAARSVTDLLMSIPQSRPSGRAAQRIGFALLHFWRTNVPSVLDGTFKIARRDLLIGTALLIHRAPEPWYHLPEVHPARALRLWQEALAILHRLGIVAWKGEVCRRSTKPVTEDGYDIREGWQEDWLQELVSILPVVEKCHFLAATVRV